MNRPMISGLCALMAAVAAAGCGQAGRETAEGGLSSGSRGEPKELEGSLTVKTFWDEDMEAYIQDFTALHPGVTIRLVRPGEDQAISFDDYCTQTAVELLGGGGPDLVEVDGMAVYRYGKTGALCDLYPMMDADPDFCREDYYTNIFAAKEYWGALYSMPCSFLYDVVYASGPLLAEAKLTLPDSLNYQEMLSLQKKVRGSAGAAPRLMPGLNPFTFFWYEYPEYYDPAAGTARFTSPEFLRYLRLTRDNIPFPEENDLTRIVGDDAILRRDYLFCRNDITGGADLINFLCSLENAVGPVPLVSSSGRRYFRTMREYAIPSGSGNKELAWEFLKFYIGERDYPDDPLAPEGDRCYFHYCHFIPINKANFFGSFRFMLDRVLSYDPRPDLPWREGDREAMIQTALEQIHRWNGQRTAEQAEGEIYGLLCQDLDSCYRGLLTPEETAKRLQNRMTIFLQE